MVVLLINNLRCANNLIQVFPWLFPIEIKNAYKAKDMYARLLDATLAGGAEDTNGILFVRFPIVELAAALSRSSVTVKRSLKELEDAGLILRVRQGVGEPNRIYTLLPKKEGCRDE